MTFCADCGTLHRPDARFCERCGTPAPVPAPAPLPYAPPSVLPPAPPTAPYPSVHAAPPTAPHGWPGPAAPSYDFGRLLRGNWPAAAATAGTALGVALLGSSAIVALASPELDLWDWLVAVVALAGSVFTIDFAAQSSSDDVDAIISFGSVPLVLTTLSLGLACLVFRRMTRRTMSFLTALADAARAGLLLGVALLALAIVFRTDLSNNTLDYFDFDDSDDVRFGLNRGSAFFLGLVVLFVVLALASILRRDWLPARMQRVHDLVAVPITAAAVLVASLPLLGILSYGALFTADDAGGNSDDDLSWNQAIAVLLVSVSNAGMQFLGVGAGGRWGGSFEYRSEQEGDESDTSWDRLASLVDESEAWGLWFSVPVMLVTVGLLAWFVLRRSHGRQPLGNLLVWGGLSFVVFGWLMRMSSVHANGNLEIESFDDDDVEGSFTVFGGLPFADTLLLALIAAAAVTGLALAAGLVDLRAIGARLKELHSTGGPTGGPTGNAPTPPPAAWPTPMPPQTPTQMPPPYQPPPG